MVKLTYPRSTSRNHGTRWDLNSCRGIRIPHRVPLYHGPIKATELQVVTIESSEISFRNHSTLIL